VGGPIAWHVELTVKPGRLETFQALTSDMVEFTRREAGVLAYQRFVADDGAVHVYERYADSAAALAHLKNFAAHFSARFGAMVERRSFTVFGDPSDELRDFLLPLGAVFARPFGDFPYWG
jgi:quinol monooxygenase YgiN